MTNTAADLNIQAQRIEMSIEDAQKKVELRNALNRLKENKDFKVVIEKGLFADESRRLVLWRADPAAQEEHIQKDTEDQITTIGGLYQYFLGIWAMGAGADKALADDIQTRNDIIKERAELESA